MVCISSCFPLWIKIATALCYREISPPMHTWNAQDSCFFCCSARGVCSSAAFLTETQALFVLRGVTLKGISSFIPLATNKGANHVKACFMAERLEAVIQDCSRWFQSSAPPWLRVSCWLDTCTHGRAALLFPHSGVQHPRVWGAEHCELLYK